MYFECLPVLQTQERELYILAHLIPMGTTQGNVLWGGAVLRSRVKDRGSACQDLLREYSSEKIHKGVRSQVKSSLSWVQGRLWSVNPTAEMSHLEAKGPAFLYAWVYRLCAVFLRGWGRGCVTPRGSNVHRRRSRL